MKLKFEGGPWDGVELASDFAPFAFKMRIEAEEQTKSQQLDIPQQDPENAEFGNPLAAMLDTDPIEIQFRDVFYKREEVNPTTIATYRVSEDDLHWMEDIPSDDDG